MKKLLLPLLAFLLFSTCKKNNSDQTNPPSIPPTSQFFASDTSSNKSTGLRPATLAELQSIPIIDTSLVPVFGRGMNLKSSWSLAVPPPKKQGYENCVGWAIGYGMMGYQFKVLGGYSDYNSQDNIFSPAYIWNQLNGRQNVGIGMVPALELVKQQGCCKWGYMPEDLTPFSESPSANARANASDYKVPEFHRIEAININLIKFFLSKRNYPLPFSCWVDKGFQQCDKNFFEQRQGGKYVWKKESGINRVTHAMLLCGYNDSINAFKVLNSWGTGWGDSGFVWIDYDFFKTIVLKNPFGGFENPEIFFAIIKRPGVTTGTQTWMLKNLDITTYRNGDPIPQVTDYVQWANLTTGAWCYHDNDPANGATYGKLYNWYAVNDPRGLAPQGWHVPDNDEWLTLATNLGGIDDAGGKMKETGFTHWKYPNSYATNSSGFTGLPGGARRVDGYFPTSLDVTGGWWSSTEDIGGSVSSFELYYISGRLNGGSGDKQWGWSVRCIKD